MGAPEDVTHYKSYEYQVRDGLLVVQAEGNVSIEETAKYIEIICKKITEEGPLSLLLADNGSGVIPTKREMNYLCDIISLCDILEDRVAICVKNRIQETMGKLFLKVFKHAQVQVVLFTDQQAAEDWLRGE